jgi:hypothetical protein
MGNEPRNDGRYRRHAECSQDIYDTIVHPETRQEETARGA